MTEFDIQLTDQAERDLDDIVAFIRQQWSERIKTDFLATVSHKMQLLATMPYMYRASQKEPTVRECIVNSYVTMYYRVLDEKERIEILAFSDNRQQNNRF